MRAVCVDSRIPVSIAKIDTPFPAVQWVHTSQRDAGGWGLQRGGWEGWGLGVGWLARMNSHGNFPPEHARGPLCSPGASDVALAEQAAGDARIGREGGSNPAWARSRVRAGNLVTTRWTGFATTCVRRVSPDKRDQVKQLLPQTGSMRSIWICVVDGPCRAGSHAMSGEKRGGSSPKTKV